MTTGYPAQSAPGGVAIRLEGVTRRYGQGHAALTATDDVTLDIAAGSTVALVGASGSGKSTLLHLVGAMDRPDAGTITVGGQDITSLRPRRLAEYRQTLGFVFQRFHLLPAVSVLDNVLAPVLPRRVSFDRKARAMELLDAVGLADRAAGLPSQLSGGEQQRVAIARALVTRPSLILCDEPTGNLDSATGAEVLDLLTQMRDDVGATLLLATHDAQVASRCERVVRLHDGAIVDDFQLESRPAGDLLEQIGQLDTR